MPGLLFRSQKFPSLENTVLIQLIGGINAKTICEFQEKLCALQTENYKRFLLDFEHVAYINSVGLGTLLDITSCFESYGGIVILFKIHAKVFDVFERLSLTAYFLIFEDQVRALEYLKIMFPLDIVKL